MNVLYNVVEYAHAQSNLCGTRPFLWRKRLWIVPDPQNLWKFSPSKVSRYNCIWIAVLCMYVHVYIVQVHVSSHSIERHTCTWLYMYLYTCKCAVCVAYTQTMYLMPDLSILKSHVRMWYTVISCMQEDTDDAESGPTPSPELVAPVLTTKQKLHVKQRVWFRVKKIARSLWTAILSVTFVFTVVAMMVRTPVHVCMSVVVFIRYNIVLVCFVFDECMLFIEDCGQLNILCFC